MLLIGTPERARWVHHEATSAFGKQSENRRREVHGTRKPRYRESQYSSSISVSFSPTVGSAVIDIRTNPWSAASLPVPPLMGPNVVAVNAVEPGFCTARVELWTKNLSPFSATYT